jgi:hypothetical protein
VHTWRQGKSGRESRKDLVAIGNPQSVGIDYSRFEVV